MNIPSNIRVGVLAMVITAGVVSCSQDNRSQLVTGPGRSPGITASSNLVTVPFDPRNFVSGVDNPYFPLPPGKIYTYKSVSRAGEELNPVEVTRANKSILGVAITVVHDQVFIGDGSLAEDTFDWYAQDRHGNVWYFGEDTKQYDHGVLVTTVGSWEAGKNGAKAGIIMLAHPQIGDVYKQEDAPGVVADMGKVVSLTETASVPYGDFTNCIETTEWTPLEPGDRSHKFYAPGLGNVLEVSTRQGGERVELISVK